MSHPEPLSHIVPRALNEHAHGGRRTVDVSPVPSTLPDLVRHFEHIESAEHPDVVVETKSIKMSPQGHLEIPRLEGAFALNEWSQSQLGSLLGLRWPRFAENATPAELADEVNHRLARATGELRLRTTARVADGVSADGSVRAVVSPGYSPISDSRVARLLADVLMPEEVRVTRLHVGEKTTSFVVSVGKHFRPYDGSEVGDVTGSVLLRNSGTGHSSLFLTLALLRLVCRNGMTVEDGLAVKRTHRGVDDARLQSLFATATEQFMPRVERAARRLADATRHALAESVPATFERLLQDAKLPARLLPGLLAAYQQEPRENAFGVSQALTLAAQDVAPEMRIELESLAGRYIATTEVLQ